jgi:hypothetical protein
MFPSVTISFNLAPGAALSEAATGIQQAMQEIGPGGRIVNFPPQPARPPG